MVEKTPNVLPIVNINEFIAQLNENKCKIHVNYYQTRYKLFVGPSNCGKTNAFFALLLNPNELNFGNVHIYSKYLKQHKYEFLSNLLNSVESVGYFLYNEHETIVFPIIQNLIV